MANSHTALALISVCILLSLSGLGNCRVPLQREEVVREKEQSEHLVLPIEKEEFDEIAREIQPLKLPSDRFDLRGNDGIFHGERSSGFSFGRPGGCHHGKFNHRGQRMRDHMLFPVEFLDLQAESGDFHPRMDRPFPVKRNFDRGFPKGEWRHPGGETRGRENEHMPFPSRGWLEYLLHPFRRNDHRDFHPRMDRAFPEKRHFDPGFPEGEWRHPEGERRGEENEHMPFPARGRWLEFFLHPFLRHDDRPEFHPREGGFRREFGHGFPFARADEFHRRADEFRPEFRQGFPRMNKFHAGGDEFRPEFGQGFPRMDKFHPGGDEFRPEFGHGFPRMDKFHPGGDEYRPEFGHGFPRADEFHPRTDEFRPEFGHGFRRMDKFHPGGEDEFRPEFGHGFPRMDKFHPGGDEFSPEFGHGFPRKDKYHPGGDERRPEFDHGFPRADEFRPREDEFTPEFGHGFPNGGELRQHRDETGGSEHWKKQDVFVALQPESEEFHPRLEEFMHSRRERESEHGFPGREGRQPRHGHGEEEKEIEQPELPVRAESTEFRSGVEEFSPLRREREFERSFPGGDQQYKEPFKTE